MFVCVFKFTGLTSVVVNKLESTLGFFSN